MVVHFRGQTYIGNTVKVLPRPGRHLGVGSAPGCQVESQVDLAAIPGVPPLTALQAAEWNAVVLVNRKQQTLPPTVTRLFHTPTCRPGNSPIRLRGRWDGILRPDGRTEVSMVPPYNVDLLVRDSSSNRYERAFLTVRVPASLGRPLTEHDVQAYLLHRGWVSATVRCRAGRYVASAISALAPPS